MLLLCAKIGPGVHEGTASLPNRRDPPWIRHKINIWIIQSDKNVFPPYDTNSPMFVHHISFRQGH